jgi:hypothetical protein
MKRGKINGSIMDSRTMMRDDYEGGKPYLCGLVRSHYSINCSNVFVKGWHSFATRVCLTASVRLETYCPDSIKSHATTISYMV